MSQVTADFSSDIVEGCAPLVVKFSDRSSGNPSSWRWEMGDGTILYVRNPATTYFIPGTYTVKLVASNPNGTDSVVRVSYINVYAVPQVNFRASDTSGCFPLVVQFNDLSIPMSGTIVSHEWDFGDGSSSREKDPVHTYTALGSYNVSLRVRNSDGCVNTLTLPRYVNIGTGLTSGFTFDAPQSCRPPTSVRFKNTSTGTGDLTYAWDFGDGVISLQKDPVHQYLTPGSYHVRLVTTNSFGCRDTSYSNGPISVGAVSAAFAVAPEICAGANLSINNQSDPTPQSVRWSFGDGTFSTQLEPLKSYESAGTYVIKLVSNFGACSDSIQKTIRVLPKPQVNFTGLPLSSCKAPLTTTFTNSTTGASTFNWRLGDGESSAEASPQHVYNRRGSFDVTLLATNQLGCSDSLTRRGYISIERPNIQLRNLPIRGCVPQTYRAATTSVRGDSIVRWQWDFGDGNSSAESNPIHEYTRPGTYTIKLHYTTAEGCEDSVIYQQAVRLGTKPTVDFAAIPPVACAFQPISFEDLTTGSQPDQWQWDFGDGTISTDRLPFHTYQDTGQFTIVLTVWNNGCRDSLQKVNYVNIRPPVALFRDSMPGCEERLTRHFIDESIGATSWLWDFGNGTTSNLQNPVHIFSAPGSYIVTLTVSNDSCQNTMTRQVIIASVSAEFSASDTAVCKYEPVTFAAIDTDPVQAASFQWNFGDNTSGSSSVTAHSYAAAGNYTVELIATDIYGCRDTLAREFLIRVNGPTADFLSGISTACDYVPIAFEDRSLTDSLNGLKQWKWDFGDGTVDSLAGNTVSHIYTARGSYTVVLTVTDSAGCSDRRSRPASVFISKPFASFETADTISCTGAEVSFRNLSNGLDATFAWDLGDSTYSAAINPAHRYSQEGSYTITVLASDRYGCKDTATRFSYIQIRDPIADFYVSDSVATCPPLVVDFTNSSQNFNEFIWDFGDGTSSTNANPGHFYTFPGNYRATLFITSPGGCRDSLSRNIVVRGPEGSFSYNVNSGCNPTTVSFVGETKDDASFVWDFNDGSVEHGDSLVSHTFARPGFYLPRMILVDPAGCRVPILGNDTIRIYGVEAGYEVDENKFCDSAIVHFHNSSTSNDIIDNYYWQFSDGPESTEKDAVRNFLRTGQIGVRLIAETRHNCTDTFYSVQPIVIASSPSIDIESAIGSCIPATATFKAIDLYNRGENLELSWDLGQAPKPAGDQTVSTTYNTAGQYNVVLVAENQDGCRDTAMATYTAYPLPPVDAGLNNVVCVGDLATLNATGADSYRWYPAEQLSCIDCPTTLSSTRNTKTYFVEGKNSFGCVSTDSTQVMVKHPFEISTTSGDTICRGESILLTASGAELYNWSPSTGLQNPAAGQTRASPQETILYRVIGRDDANCFTDTAYIPVTVYPYPVVEAGPDQQLSVGNSVQFSPQYSPDVTAFRWSPSASLSCSTCPDPIASPRQDTRFSLSVINEGGCAAQDEINVHVFCSNTNLFLPNTFSPNGDGRNDIFYPRGKGLFIVRTFRVFNRWGEVVFEKTNFLPNDQSFGWDGMYKRAPAQQDVYVYMVEIICENQAVLHHKGNVTLLR